jgi:dolichol-phosphate mannosyltransferase
MYESPFWSPQSLSGPIDFNPPPRPRLSIVIPCYNEESCLAEVYERVSLAAKQAAGDDYEIVFVDDGSKDQTWAVINSYGRQDKRVLALRLSRNHGHQLALSAGLDLCHGELILIIDADLQDPPELLPSMMELMQAQHADVVYAVREQRSGETWLKRVTARAFYRVLSAASDGAPIPMDTGDFRLITRRALDVLRAMPERSRFIRGMVAWIGFTQIPFRYKRDERFAGQTGYPLGKMLRLALDALTGFSSAPLRLAGYAGMLFSLLAVLLIGYSLIEWSYGHTIPGWTSLMVMSLVIGSVQMFVLSMLGEYVGRLYNQAQDRPLYIVSEISGRMRSLPTQGIVSPPDRAGVTFESIVAA